MSDSLIQYAFVAGEVAKRLWGRSDFEKYDFGLARAFNWFVDYRGGASTRPGMEFIDVLADPTYETRYFPFQFSPDTEDTYLVVFGRNWIRFVQDGGYVLETAKTISAITEANPGVVTATAHGYSNGDLVILANLGGMVELSGRTVVVANKTTDTFELQDVHGNNINTTAFTTYTSGGSAYRVYTIASPYTHTDLAKLQAFQIRDTLRLTHPEYPIKNLTRADHTSWSISNEPTGNVSNRPINLAHSVGSAGTAGVLFCMTAVYADGSESIRSDYRYVTNTNDYSVSAGFVTVTWDPVPDAVSYRIYRSIIVSDNTQLNNSMQFGYVGFSKGPQFTDNNLIPDFSVGPPENYNPFAPGRLVGITITNAGSGYASPTTSIVASGGGGSGIIIYPLVVGGKVVAGYIVNAGSGYTSAPTLTVNGAGGVGSGATATATIGPTTGMYPATSTLFQQRQIYAGSDNAPLTIFGSKPGQFKNFDAGEIIISSDAYEFDIEASTVSPIRHLMNMRGGLLLMSAAGIWQLTGGSTLAVTPTNAFAEPQTYFGAASVEPFNVDTDILYVTEKESTVRLLSYNDYSKLYGGQDMSILSSHLFSRDNEIVRWTYAETPHRLVWAVLRDGTFLAFTIVREQNVFAWCPQGTKGEVKDVICLTENNKDVVYLAVERVINGQTVKYIERFAQREVTYGEDAICADASLFLAGTVVNTTLTITEPDENNDVTLTAGANAFVIGDIGKVIRAGGGKIIVTGYTSATVVTGRVVREIVSVIPTTTLPKPLASGEWTLDAETTVIRGLWHLEGETVAVLGDGSVFNNQVVTNGQITLEAAATRVVIGIPYSCIAQTLPAIARTAIIEGKKKRIVGLAFRRLETLGVEVGRTLDTLQGIKDRTVETYGEPVQLKTDVKYRPISTKWDENGQTYIVQHNPLPASILGLVSDMELGDEQG